MPSRRFPTTRRTVVSRKRQLAWATLDTTPLLAIAPQQQSFDILGQFVSGFGVSVGSTVRALYLDIYANWTGAAVGDQLSIGVLVATRSLDVGSPTPGNLSTASTGRDWMYLRKVSPETNVGALGQERYSVNLRSMRKLRQYDDTLVLCLNHTVGAAALQCHVFARCLVALP